ncbi:glutamyl-tRNA synthetase, cytoplasmic isoform X1 [Zea mays]|uniref:glutamate--tRNA ligase n=1 Tax=Zea mays TaxID=4577 RepID=A0A804RBJ8_MAIZE|nr:glutamyl-tRNA synthetase, cytoplasmic isoform X1 [Zea mays]|eukprot:XP_008658555.1 glutamyl-tRNA synthetase, cytoplasmic isoform X1 [Zea mays]
MEATLAFSQDSPPISIICAAKFVGLPLTIDPSLASGLAPTLRFASGESLHGVNPILLYIASGATIPCFSGKNDIEFGHVVEWLEYVPIFLSGSEFENACLFVDGFLASRTFLVGHGLTIADIVVWSNLAGIGQRWESLRKSKKYQNLVRWFNSIDSEYSDTLNEVLAAYVGKRGIGKSPAPSLKEKVHVSKDPSAPEVDLPGAKVGKVCVRFAPEPSGYLHIGHAKAGLLNKYFAERYQGRLIVRFDDTNPSKESNEFVENVLKDIETLGIKYDAVTYTSDYFPKLMEMAGSLIKQGKAYIDDTPKEQMRKERMDGIESRCRNSTVEENLSLWNEMVNGTERGMQCCVRGKLDMQDPNKSLRDPVYYRCNIDPHHRVGSKYKVYPTYDFACPFVDALEGVTHALRSSEYHDRNAQYYRILQDMGLRRVEIYEFSRLNMVYTLLSKRKLLWFVQNKKVEDWTDPRFPTVQGIVRRGLKIEALIQFILQQGASKNLNLMEWDKLWTINKKIIDPLCARHTAVLKDQRVIFTLTNGPEKPFVRILPRHKKFVGAGKKATTFANRIWLDYADAAAISKGEEVTLMDWGNAIVKEIKVESGVITELVGELHLEGSVKTTKLKITWLADIEELVPLSLVEFDYLISKKKLEEDDDFLENLNPCTRRENPALGDANMMNLKRGEIIQLERKGYYRSWPRDLWKRYYKE